LEHPFKGQETTFGQEFAIQSYEDGNTKNLEERIRRLEEALEEGKDKEEAALCLEKNEGDIAATIMELSE
ncbi:MAG: hypothetical protein Q8N63_05725, partial [Nanoarchaeota archaeon]|nr:hypothetical protein [Nanoarchaeota archaeon]